MNDFHERVAKLEAMTKYKPDYSIIVGETNGRVYVQVRCQRLDAITGKPGVGFGGKIYLSPHMVDGEIIRKIFQAYLGYEEHESREFFRYKDAQVFGPHIHIEALVEAAQHTEYRPEGS